MAARFYDGRQAAPHAVSVAVGGGVIRIWSSDGRVAEQWQASRTRAQPLHGGVVAFRLADGLSRLQVDDPALLAVLRPAVRRWRRPQAGWRLMLAATAGVVALAVLLADEPTGNLDVATSALVFEELLRAVRGQGVAALIATHNPELAARMDRRVTLAGGRIVEA